MVWIAEIEQGAQLLHEVLGLCGQSHNQPTQNRVNTEDHRDGQSQHKSNFAPVAVIGTRKDRGPALVTKGQQRETAEVVSVGTSPVRHVSER